MATIRPPRNGTTSSSSHHGGSRKRSRSSSSSSGLFNVGRILFHMVVLALTFYGGIVVGMHSGATAGCPDTSASSPIAKVRGGRGGRGGGISDEQIESIVEKRLEVELSRRAKQDGSGNAVSIKAGGSTDPVPRMSRGMSEFAFGMARMKRDELIKTYDYGSASQHFDKGTSEEAIMLYTKSALPSDHTISAVITGNDGNLAPMLDVTTATANCDVLNVITINPRNSATCTAIISDYESFHIQRWMRQSENARRSRESRLERNLPLRHVGRGVQANALDSFPAP